MPQATFRFYEELNDFLPPERRRRAFEHRFDGTPSVKDQIEALGVPHTEVDLIVVDGEPAGFDRLLRGGERVAVYPMFETLDIGPIARLRPAPLREPRFVLDVHLRTLARRLRMLGFDAAWPGDVPDETLAALSVDEGRILLTRDRGLLKRRDVLRGYCPRSPDPERQVREVVRRFDLGRLARPFTRCIACNAELAPARAEEIAGAVPADILRRHARFARCRACGRVYWPGTHFERMSALVAELVGDR
ncbi:MAG: twitching motility protein PilT [Acidobacteria bacterium]|nr:MAG: twitching motility protein PilT [Acidobacteriota bacterium]